MGFQKGREKTGGRKRGTPDKATSTLKAAFQKHEKHLVKALLALTKSNDEQVRIKAIQACLDRGWGRPPQPVTGPEGEGPAIVKIEWTVVDPAEAGSEGL